MPPERVSDIVILLRITSISNQITFASASVIKLPERSEVINLRISAIAVAFVTTLSELEITLLTFALAVVSNVLSKDEEINFLIASIDVVANDPLSVELISLFTPAVDVVANCPSNDELIIL